MKVLAPINENEDAVDKKYVDDSIKNGTLTIQKNGTNIQTFTANQSTNATANITVPTKVSELTNDSGYTTNTGTITQVKLDGANVATSGVANVQAIPVAIGNSSIGGTAGNITTVKKYGSVLQNGNLIIPNLLTIGMDRFYYAHKKGAAVSCNYYTDGQRFIDGDYSGYDTNINPSTAFTTTPFVWTITKTSSFEYTDVVRLLLIGHRLYTSLMVKKYKIEVAYAYSNNTYSWATVIDYDGDPVDICQKYYGLYCSSSGIQSYHPVFGIRLTISESTSTVFTLAAIQLVSGRGTEQPWQAIHAVPEAGGTFYGGITAESVTAPTINGTSSVKVNGTNVALSTQAIKNITRSGTTFTATRCDDTTFTFTQQDNNTIPAAYCDTAAGTATKTASCTGYALAVNTYLHIIIVNSNTSANALTLNVNGKGAKPIYINEDPSGSTNYTLPAGSYICYYDGTNYYFNTDGKLPHLSGAAYTGVDTTLVQGSASTNVPTSAAVVDYINSMGYGANNVYVGTTEPVSDNIQLWVNPEGMTVAKNGLYVAGAVYLEGNKLFWYE